MRILVDILHPAQVHFFKHLIWQLRRNKEKVLVTASEKDVALELLRKLNIPCVCVSRRRATFLGKALGLFERDVGLMVVAKRFRPDVMLAQTGVSIGIVGALLGIPRIVLEEAEHAHLQRLAGLPFATVIMTGTGYLKEHGTRQRRFRGIWVQSYLNPGYFQPDPEILRRGGVDPSARYIVLRTVSWDAAHDIGKKGVNEEDLHTIVKKLERFGRVIISSESLLPDSLKGYQNPLPVEHMHHLLAYATLYIGEGATMAAEAAVLGTPAICCNQIRWGYLLALEERYELLYNAKNFQDACQIADELLHREDLRETWRERRECLLRDSEDIVAFMLDLVKHAVCQNKGEQRES